MKQSISVVNILALSFVFFLGTLLPILIYFFDDFSFVFEINIIDFLSLLATITLSIVVVYLAKSLDKKDIARNIVVEDLNKLCDIYSENRNILGKLQSKNKNYSLTQARQAINLNFHRADLLIDRINKELEVSFSSFYKKLPAKELSNQTLDYWKWVTDGPFMIGNFTISSAYIKDHETNLCIVHSNINLLIHKLIKSI